MSDDKEQQSEKELATIRSRERLALVLTIMIVLGSFFGSILFIKSVVTHSNVNSDAFGFIIGTVVFAILFLTYLGSAGESAASQIAEIFLRASFKIARSATDLAFPLSALDSSAHRSNFENRIPTESIILNEEERTRLIYQLEERIKFAAADDVVSNEFLGRIKEIQVNSIDATRLRAIDGQFDTARARLDQAIKLLHRKANINMLIGVLLSGLGIFFLGITVAPGLFNRIFSFSLDFTPPSEGITDPTEFWIHYLPRVTLAIVLELFAYFFLNLYKANAVETRYYHNEITNISARHSALISASNPRDPELLKLVITDLLKTERNGTLTKSQTTVEIARAKAEADSSKDLVSVVTKLADSFGKALGKAETKT